MLVSAFDLTRPTFRRGKYPLLMKSSLRDSTLICAIFERLTAVVTSLLINNRLYDDLYRSLWAIWSCIKFYDNRRSLVTG